MFSVQAAEDNKQAFALLVASGIGMMVSALEFLDNGQGGGGAVALDGNFTQQEGQAAVGLSSTGSPTNFVAWPATLASGPLAGAPYFSGNVGGTPYIFACPDFLTADSSWCDGNPAVQVNADTGAYGNGAGFQGALQGAVNLTSATSAILVFQITDLTLPFAVNPAQVPVLHAFSGQGNAAQSFAIGIEGYLDRMQKAQIALNPTGSASLDALSDAIDAIKGQLDNGGQCLNTINPAIPAAFNAIAPVYLSAIGTATRPMPPGAVPPNFFQSYNRVTGLTVAGLPAAPAANQFVFGQPPGTVSAIGYRFLYATAAGLGAFTPAQATPRIDETPAAFQQAFEAMLLAPSISPARDTNISYAELLCIGAGAPPTGVKATAASGQVTLTWNAVGGATAYTVYRGTQPGVTQTNGSTAFPITVPLLAPPTPPFTDPSAVVGTTYYYVVTSTNASGEGGVSREVTATP